MFPAVWVLGGFSRSPSYRCIKWAWLEILKRAKMLVVVMMMLVLSQQKTRTHTQNVNKCGLWLVGCWVFNQKKKVGEVAVFVLALTLFSPLCAPLLAPFL